MGLFILSRADHSQVSSVRCLPYLSSLVDWIRGILWWERVMVIFSRREMVLSMKGKEQNVKVALKRDITRIQCFG